MKLTFIGTGAAFTSNNYHSNILIELGGKRLLIDCGSDARFALRDIGLSYQHIDGVYISHIHADHVGGLEWLGFSTKFDPSCTVPTIIAHQNILANLWEHSLCAGMQTLDEEVAQLDSYFKPVPLEYPGSFEWEGVNFRLVKTLHVRNCANILDSYGLFFEVNGKKIFLSTDTRPLFDEAPELYETSHVIFHDCETQSQPSGVHSHYTELVHLPEHIKQKMWLYHYNSSPLPDSTKDGFMGFVPKGKSFEF